MKRIILLVVVLAAWPLCAEESWRFLLLADWHQAEKYTQGDKNPGWLAEAVAEDVVTVKMLKKNYGGELIMLPGDTNGGHWDTPAFIKNNFPGSSPEEAVLKAGHLCYSGMIQAFKEGGYSKLLMAVGDHEVGDNPWPAGSAVSRCQPQFRTAFAREFNRNPDGGRFLYETPIGKAPSRPLGTPYEETSYAYRHKNVLFVTMDVFHQESPDKVIGDEGTVTGTVVGEHLQWLESVLSEARKDAGIRHIFVQAHLPVIYPVRKVNSSGMLMDDSTRNPFWQLLRKYKVDMYFAGEVHANTVTKDPQSDLVQLVSRGNFFNNFQTLDISNDRIEVVCYNQLGQKTSDGEYEMSGKLVIDKSGPKTSIDGSGELALLDPSARHFHFSFEEDVALSDHPIMGLSGRQKKEDAKTLRGVKCTRLIPNLGTFGPHYSALKANLETVAGPQGRAAEFSEDSRMGVYAMGPLHGDHAVSYALWIKTASPENQVLINSGSIWGGGMKNFFNLHLNNGAPEIMISKSQKLVADANLSDGKWHHLAATMPKDGCKLSEVQIYVDGKPVKTKVSGLDRALHFDQAVRLGFGGFNYSHKAYDSLPVKSFMGAMDEISIWTRPLDAGEVAVLASRP